MSKPFRPHIRVLTEHRVPSPTFVVAWTGVDYWRRVDVPTDVLLMPTARKLREVGRLIRTYHAERKGRTLPFGAITGYLLVTLPDRAIRFSVEDTAMGAEAAPGMFGEVGLRLR